MICVWPFSSVTFCEAHFLEWLTWCTTSLTVPTSVGYGASFGGLSALLSMLNSCASGVSVVNIDNGFGAGYLAARINSLVTQGNQP